MTQEEIRACHKAMQEAEVGDLWYAVWRAGREYERAEQSKRITDRVDRLKELTESMRSEIGAIAGGTHGA